MSADKYLDYSKEHLDSILSDLFGNKQPSSKKDAIFIAGSPGAGKSEVAHLLADSYKNMIVLDTDDFRCLFPDYDGSNSSNFQKACSWLTEQAFQYLTEKGYSFIYDTTFAVPSTEKKIKRVLKNGYRPVIFYVYQEPKIAWQFTKDRERVEGRKVPKETFINAFLHARENVEKVKVRHPETLVHLIIKDYQNTIEEVHFDMENINLILPNNNTRETLEEELYE